MIHKHNHSSPYFLFLVVIALMLIGVGLIVSWHTGQLWIRNLWQICQIGLEHLQERLPAAWQLIIPGMVLVVLVRSGLSIRRHVRAAQRLKKLFLPLQKAPPTRLKVLLTDHNLSVEDVVFLDLAVPKAFCLGIWRPRIWLTAGLVELLTTAELTTVLAHEAHHYHQQDPLRLLIGRTLKSAFFFLPIVGNLADAEELQQEIAADQSAIQYFGDDLPLLCALQKLLAQGSIQTQDLSRTFSNVIYSPFNVTEARLRRLIYPAQFANQYKQYLRIFTQWGVSLSIIIILGSTIFLSPQLEEEQTGIEQCVDTSISAVQHQSLLLDYNVGK